MTERFSPSETAAESAFDVSANRLRRELSTLREGIARSLSSSHFLRSQSARSHGASGTLEASKTMTNIVLTSSVVDDCTNKSIISKNLTFETSYKEAVSPSLPSAAGRINDSFVLSGIGNEGTDLDESIDLSSVGLAGRATGRVRTFRLLQKAREQRQRSQYFWRWCLWAARCQVLRERALFDKGTTGSVASIDGDERKNGTEYFIGSYMDTSSVWDPSYGPRDDVLPSSLRKIANKFEVDTAQLESALPTSRPSLQQVRIHIEDSLNTLQKDLVRKARGWSVEVAAGPSPGRANEVDSPLLTSFSDSLKSQRDSGGMDGTSEVDESSSRIMPMWENTKTKLNRSFSPEVLIPFTLRKSAWNPMKNKLEKPVSIENAVEDIESTGAHEEAPTVDISDIVADDSNDDSETDVEEDADLIDAFVKEAYACVESIVSGGAPLDTSLASSRISSSTMHNETSVGGARVQSVVLHLLLQATITGSFGLWVKAFKKAGIVLGDHATQEERGHFIADIVAGLAHAASSSDEEALAFIDNNPIRSESSFRRNIRNVVRIWLGKGFPKPVPRPSDRKKLPRKPMARPLSPRTPEISHDAGCEAEPKTPSTNAPETPMTDAPETPITARHNLEYRRLLQALDSSVLAPGSDGSPEAKFDEDWEDKTGAIQNHLSTIEELTRKIAERSKSPSEKEGGSSVSPILSNTDIGARTSPAVLHIPAQQQTDDEPKAMDSFTPTTPLSEQITRFMLSRDTN